MFFKGDFRLPTMGFITNQKTPIGRIFVLNHFPTTKQTHLRRDKLVETGGVASLTSSIINLKFNISTAVVEIETHNFAGVSRESKVVTTHP